MLTLTTAPGRISSPGNCSMPNPGPNPGASASEISPFWTISSAVTSSVYQPEARYRLAHPARLGRKVGDGLISKNSGNAEPLSAFTVLSAGGAGNPPTAPSQRQRLWPGRWFYLIRTVGLFLFTVSDRRFASSPAGQHTAVAVAMVCGSDAGKDKISGTNCAAVGSPLQLQRMML